MRTDVKLGIVSSMAVVLVAGGYFLFRGDSQAPIPIADKVSPTAPKTAAKPPAGKQPVTNSSRQVTSSKENPARTNPSITRDPKVAAKPAERPATQPISGSLATAPTIPVNRPPAAEPKIEIVQPGTSSLVERSPVSTPATPVGSPAGIVSAPVASGESDAGHTSRTLMAGGDAPKSAPTTPGDSSTFSSPAFTTPIVATKPEPSTASSENKADLAKAAVDTHRVQPGDSLASLAQTYYGNAKYAKFLAESNPGISDPARLALGATIKIPPLPQDIDTRSASALPAKTPPAASGSAASKRTYKVKSGDSFYRIAKDQLGNAERWKELLDLNKTLVHGDPSSLQPGQTLILPDS